MKKNQKDVNEYFKYLRLYYIELLKKQKKENNKTSRKKIVVKNEDDEDDDINVFEKNTTNRKKIIRSAKLKKKKKEKGFETEVKEEDKSKISKRIVEEIVKRNENTKKKKKKEEIEIIRKQQEKEFEEAKLEQEKNIEEEKRKKEEENNKNLVYEDVRKKINLKEIDEKELNNFENISELDIEHLENEIDQIINDIENYRNPRIGKQLSGSKEEKESKEIKEEIEIELPIAEEVVEEDFELEEVIEEDFELEEEVIEEEIEEPDVELEEEVVEEKIEEPDVELEEEAVEEEIEEPDVQLEDVNIKKQNIGAGEEKNLEEEEQELVDEEQKLVDEEQKLVDEEQELVDEEKIEKEKNLEQEEKKPVDEEQEKELVDKENLEEEKKPVNEEELEEEEKIKIGKEEFIDAINKKITEDYKSLHNLEMENHRLTQELENARDVGDVDKLLERIHANQNEITNIIGRIEGIQNGEIIKEAYSFSKTKPKELKEFIKVLEKEHKNYRYIDEFYKPHFKDKIDYIDRVTRLKNETDAKEQEIQERKDTFANLDNKRDDNDVELERYNKRRFYFENKLLKFQIALNTLQTKVQNIRVEEKKITRYFLGNIEIKNGLQLRRIAMNIYNQPDNDKDFNQIYHELQSRLTVIEESKLVPNANYKNILLNEKNNIINTGFELNTTIQEIRQMKEEFKEEFSDYYDNAEYFSYLEEIEKMERKFVNQTDKISMLNSKVDQTIIENDNKIAQIEQMNIGRDNIRVLYDPNNPQQQYQNGINNYYQNQNPYGDDEYEQERSRGRGR